MADGSNIGGPQTSSGVPESLQTAAGIIWRLLLILAAICLVAVALFELRILTVPVFVALLITSLLLPLVEWLEKRGWRPGLATGTVLLGVVVIIAALVWTLTEPISSQFQDLGPQVNKGIDDVTNWLKTGPLHLTDADLDKYVDDARNSLRTNAGGLQTSVVEGATLVGEVLVGLVVTIILTIFFTKDHRIINQAILGRVPWRHREVTGRAMSRAFRTLSMYLRGVAMTGVVDAVCIGIALAIIGVPLVVPLMILTFVGAFFPVVGATAAGAIAALVALVSGGAQDAILVIVAVLLVQQLEGHILQPLLVGRSVRLHPVVIISSLIAGSIVAGILGAFVAVPIVAMIVSAVREVEAAKAERSMTPPVTS